MKMMLGNGNTLVDPGIFNAFQMLPMKKVCILNTLRTGVCKKYNQVIKIWNAMKQSGDYHLIIFFDHITIDKDQSIYCCLLFLDVRLRLVYCHCFQ